MFDFFGDGNAFSLKTLNQSLASMPEGVTEIEVHINSGGGLVSEGFAIYDKLISLNIPVTTIVEGMCGSIATVIAQAGKSGKRKMFQNSEWFIHNPLWIPQGPDAHNADDLEKLTDELRRNETKLIDFYVKTTGSDRDLLADKMKAETTLSSIEAKNMGFVDEVINTDVVAMVRYKVAAAVKPIKNDNTMSDFKAEVATGFSRIEKLIANLLKGKVVNATVKTTEGVDIYFEGELQERTKVFLDEAMTVAAPNGVHTYDNKLYTIENGEVTKIEDVVAVKTDLEIANEKIASLEATIAAKDVEVVNAKANEANLIGKVKEIETEFVNFKSKLATGTGQDFAAAGIDGKGKEAEKTLMQKTLEYRQSKNKK